MRLTKTDSIRIGSIVLDKYAINPSTALYKIHDAADADEIIKYGITQTLNDDEILLSRTRRGTTNDIMRLLPLGGLPEWRQTRDQWVVYTADTRTTAYGDERQVLMSALRSIRVSR